MYGTLSSQPFFTCLGGKDKVKKFCFCCQKFFSESPFSIPTLIYGESVKNLLFRSKSVVGTTIAKFIVYDWGI
jgi:hypothetical protein